MKRFSSQDLWGLVNRADTHERVATAEAFLRRLTYVDNELFDELMIALSFISRELYRRDREEDREYSPSCPWNAPGMNTRDFVR